MRYLRDRWVKAVREMPQVQVLTPDEPGMSGGDHVVSAARANVGRTTIASSKTLLTRHGIFTRRSPGVDGGDCVRVTPALYRRPADVDRLAEAIKQLS